MALASFGGPLALAALYAPPLSAGLGSSGGWAMLVALAMFVIPLTIWMRYATRVQSSGGLYSFVAAAAGPRVALVQASIWIVSYLLYVIYTTVQIVYDVLPVVISGERAYQTLLTLLIPAGLAAVIIAGRTTALVVIGLIAVGQLALAVVMDAVTLAHLGVPAAAFGTAAHAETFVRSSALTSLLYICGSLPLFLGGEVARPSRTIRRGVLGAFAVTGIVVVAAVAPLASAPGLARTDLPGVRVVQQFAGAGLAQAIGIGVAASIAGVMLCEYLALTRLVHAVSSVPTRSVAVMVGLVLLLVTPFSLINPDGFYNALIEPSLIALWISQLMVFAVYPRFARRHGLHALAAWTLGLGASALAGYGLWTAVTQATT